MDAATIEETNRIRISLGMKPLPVPGADASNKQESNDADSDGEVASTLESRQAQAYDNYNKAMEAENAKRKREEKAAAIRKARDQAQLHAVIEGKGFGEAEEGGDLSAKDWLMGQKRRQKKIAKTRKLEEELAAAEAAAAAAVQYTSKDLAGIKVAHDTADFLDGDDQILTLKDTTIEENEAEGDELENLNMREAEKLSERLDLKKKKPGYNPHDDEEGGERSILAQYDDEIGGKKTKKFTLDMDGAIAELSDILDKPAEKARKIQSVSLDDIVELTCQPTGDTPISSDYLDPSKIKVKKPKKSKKNKGTRQKPVDEDDIFPIDTAPVDSNAMDVDSSNGAASKKRKTGDDTFVDDDDLQASLAIQRKKALKKRKKTRPEDIAKQLKEQEDEPEHAEQEEGGLVLGEVSEFVAGLSKPGENEERKPRKPKTVSKSPEPDEDHPMEDNAHEPEEEKPATSALDEVDETGVEEEKAVGEGMGAALALLRERGLVEDTRGDTEYSNLRDREEFLARKRRLEEELDDQARHQRERDRMSGKLDRMSVRDREEWARQQNTWRDQQQSRRMAELFSSGYKPNVELKYTDEHGRALDQKEAFKHLSHQFHGKGSGKGKTEKRLKKIEDEKRREAQSMFDASQSAGMSLAAQQQLKKRREAGVRLA
ncbi:SART-1 protein [Fusarium solani]|uniref:SART-1 protein n=1 Tax=Fusarium solani TaxID=169388 RepID=A0A9P9L0R1_FUSSL|nr:SART-1 protein [Fusarium solani]KAH7272087.1 SART-1 protein [Fusarium solani]